MGRSPTSHPQAEATRHLRVPPNFYWAIAAFGWGGATKCYWLSQTAGSPIPSLWALGSMGCAYLGGKMVVKALRDGDVRRDRRRMDRHSEVTANAHGQARLANRRDITWHKLTRGPGIFLGRYREGLFYGRDLYYRGENHVLTIGPAGSGKGTCVVVPNLLLNPESMVVTDLKGELYAMTGRYRRDVLGHDVVVLNPFHATLSEELGIAMSDGGYDPCSLVRPGPTVKDDAELLASLLLPMPANADAKSNFFIHAGQQELTAGMLDITRRGERLTLPRLRSWIMALPEEYEAQLLEMAQSAAFSGLAREMGGRLLSTLSNAPQQFQGGHACAEDALKPYDHFGPMGQHVCRGDGFSFETMKKRPTTVYIILPSDRGITHAPWMNLVLSSAIEMVGRDRTNKRVTFLLDELANLGYLPNLLRAMAQYRAQGVRIHACIQQVSQIRRLYGGDGWRDMVGLCDVVQSFGITELETCKLLSDMAGQTTVDDVGQNLAPGMAQGHSHGSLTYSARRVGVPLLRPQDIRAMPSNTQLIFYRNMPPLIADKVDYRERAALHKRADPNPYYERSRA